MITTDNTHTVGFRDTLSRGLPKAADNLLSIQKNVLNSVYQQRSGLLNDLLSSKPYSVHVTDSSASMTINYIAQIRFMDMKRNPRSGKVKKPYAPIYNKYVWGFLMGYTYNLLREGMAGMIRRDLSSVTLDVKI